MKKITQVLDTVAKMQKPLRLPMGGTQVTPDVAMMQRPAAQARGAARQLKKPGKR